MNKLLISVIIPIYNVEHYLVDCLNSIVNQTYNNLEIILVNDGSPDNCGAICDQYAIKDQRIRVIHKENGGLSDARNVGLDMCIGDYISFVDSDDVIHPNFYDTLLKVILDYKVDIAFCSINQFEESFSFPRYISNSCDIIVWDRKEFRNSIFDFSYYPEIVTACSKLYKRNYFEKLRFERGRIYEDTIILHHIVELTHKCVYIKQPLYYYRYNRESITKTSSGAEKKLEDALYALKQRVEFYKQLGMNQFVKKSEEQIALHKIDKYLNNQYVLGFLEKIKFLKFIFGSNFKFKTRVLFILRVFEVKS